MITLRPAQPTAADAKAFADLADMATSRLLGAVLGPRGLPMMEALFLRERNDFTHRHVHFVTVDDQIAGMICCVSDKSSRENAFRTALFQLRFLFWHLPAIFLRCRPIRSVLEFVNKAHEGHFYIPFLAIHPEFRRRGLARRLFEIAETKGRLEGCPILSLSTDPTDPVSLEFYRSCGMQESERSPTGRFRGRDEVLMRMEKPLS